MTTLRRFSMDEPDQRERSISAELPVVQPLVVDAKRLAGMLGVSVRSIRTLDAGGRLPMGVWIGGSKRWVVDEIRAWLSGGSPNRQQWETMKSSAKK